MSIPASIAISKIRMPELEEPVTRGRVVVDRGEKDTKHTPVDALHAFAKGRHFRSYRCWSDPLQRAHNLVARRDNKRPAHLDWSRVRYSPSDTAARPTIHILSYNLLPRYVHAPSARLPVFLPFSLVQRLIPCIS